MMNTLRRLLRLWQIYAYIDFIVLVRDLKTFLVWIISDTILNIAGVTGMLLLTARFHGIGSWSQMQILFLLGYAMTANSLLFTFFNMNIAHISRRVGRGQLDHVLVQPQPLWMSLLTEGFIPFSGGTVLLPGLLLLAWASAHLPLTIGIGWLFWLLLNLAGSTLVVLGFSFLWGSLAFWSPRAAEEICSPIHHMIGQLRVYPLEGLSIKFRAAFMTVLPVGFVAWYPSRALLGRDPSLLGHLGTPLAGLLFAALAVPFFRKGLKHYERTGSQRYLSHGHRR